MRPEAEQTTPETARLVHAVFYGTVLLIAWLMWRVVRPFALEIGWAVVLFLVFVPALFVGYTLYEEGAVGVEYVQHRLDDEGGPAGLFHQVWEWSRAASTA